MDYKDDKVVTLPTNYFYYTSPLRMATNPMPRPRLPEAPLPYPELRPIPR